MVGGIMKSTRTHAEAHPTIEEVAAQMRAEYKNFTPAQREIHGNEPNETLIHCRWSRIHCGRMSEEELDALYAQGMAIINGTADQPHAAHAVRS